MTTREDVIKYCLTFPDVFEDYPFRDPNWTCMRIRSSRKIFAWIYALPDDKYYPNAQKGCGRNFVESDLLLENGGQNSQIYGDMPRSHIWVNVKCDPQWRDLWRDTFESVVPAYHMNKEHWNSIILDGTVPVNDIQRMIGESYDLCR